jgi:SAM-dependent methyltransferase
MNITPISQFSQFETWLAKTPLGKAILQREQAWFDSVCIDIFGYNAVQLQLSHWDFLAASRISWRIRTGEKGELVCADDALPFDSQSLDLIALPHGLDFSNKPRELLREVERVLRPQGRLLITGFNPWSFWAYRRFFRCDPWQSHWLTLPRLKDWLALLGFESIQGQYFGYTPPIQSERWLQKGRWFEQAGDRWWPAAGSVYCLDFVKRVRGMHLITPDWKQVKSNAGIAVSDVSCHKVPQGGERE